MRSGRSGSRTHAANRQAEPDRLAPVRGRRLRRDSPCRPRSAGDRPPRRPAARRRRRPPGDDALRTAANVRCLRFTPDGKTLLSADSEGGRVWDAETGRLLRRFGDSRGRQFQDGAFSPDGSLAAMSMDEGDVTIWDARTAQPLHQFKTGRDPGLDFSPDGKTLAVHYHPAAGGERLALWDTASGAGSRELPAAFTRLSLVAFCQDGKTLLTADHYGAICFWDAASAKEMRKLNTLAPGEETVHSPDGRIMPPRPKPERSWVVKAALSPDGRTLALVYIKQSKLMVYNGSPTSWQSESEVHLWDLTAGKETYCLKGDNDAGVSALAFDPDGKLWVSDNQTIRSWDVRKGEPAGKPLDAARVSVLTFTPDGQTVATAGVDKVIRLWDVKEGREKSPAAGHLGRVYAAVFAPDGQIVATAGADATIRFWDRATGRQRGQIVRQGKNVDALAFIRDGRGLLSADYPPSDEAVRLWDATTGKELRRFAGAWFDSTPEARLLVTADKEAVVHFWAPNMGKELRRWPTSAGNLELCHISPDGRTLIAWGQDRAIHVWDAEGKELRCLEKDSLRRIYTVAASPDGRLLAFAGQVNCLVIYETAAGKEVRRFGDLPGPTSAVAFSADGRFLAAGDWADGTMRLWELASGRAFQKWTSGQGRIIAMAFAPDGSALMSGGEDTTALVWDLAGRPAPAKALSVAEVDACWSDLADGDAARAQRAVRTLAAAPAQSVSYLDKRLFLVAPVDERRTARLIADLDAEDFDLREKASAELEKLGEAAADACRRVLAGEPSAEVRRRLETLLKRQSEAWFGGSPKNLRLLRALEALEFSGSRKAKAVLQRLASGAPGATLTEEAKAALGRISSH